MRKIWKLNSNPVKAMAAITYSMSIMFMTRKPVSSEALILVNAIMICTNVTKQNAKSDATNMKKYL